MAFHPFIQEMLKGFMQIFTAISKDWSVMWLLAPVVLLWILLELYFGTHKQEKLGWNTALGNGFVLIWVTLGILRDLFAGSIQGKSGKIIIMSLFVLYGIIVCYVAFTHKAVEKVSFLLGSPYVIYFLTMYLILWGYDLLEVNLIIILDVTIIFFVLLIFKTIVRHFLPESTKDAGGDAFKPDKFDVGTKEIGGGPIGQENFDMDDMFKSKSPPPM
ncbi:MAG: hypothetical protein KJ601_02880 [Nanoarchaeota archaeon]|nr:hypothetical protein [Nanoarchaeota archaeon]MBU1704045.1 hypothetical protein [Nanoarchaeota archaeon]